MSPTQTNEYAKQLLASKDYFERSTRVLEEADSGFRPQEGMMTVAQQVAHTAQTLDWFVDGASRTEGFDLDFEKFANAVNSVTSLAGRSPDVGSGVREGHPILPLVEPEDLAKPLPPGPVMGGQPVSDVVWAMVDHTAHHRGALTVYSRSLGRFRRCPTGDEGSSVTIE